MVSLARESAAVRPGLSGAESGVLMMQALSETYVESAPQHSLVQTQRHLRAAVQRMGGPAERDATYGVCPMALTLEK